MNRAGRRPPPHRVAVLVRHGVLPMELGIIHQMFRSARSRDDRPLYDVRTCARSTGEIRTDADFSIHVQGGLRELAEADTVMVPASHELDESDEPVDAHTAAALAELPPSTRLASVCTGTFVLAAAGVLEGRRATTHWMSATRFRNRHPNVDLDPNVLYTEDGRVFTSAGEAAGIDLCLHLIRCDHGAAAANQVARRVVVPPHRAGGQAQYISRPVPEPQVSSTRTARAWAVAHLGQTITLHDLAALEASSVRTFTRRFREEIGTSPGRWLTEQRIDRARHLLEATDLSVDQVAAEAGFGTAASLRQHLRATLGVSPSAYRGTFNGTSDAPSPTPALPERGARDGSLPRPKKPNSSVDIGG